MSHERQVIVGLHFYQPPRQATHERLRHIQTDPSGINWTKRIDQESYRPLHEMGVLPRATYDLYSTLGKELAEIDPETDQAMRSHLGANGVASPSVHLLLPDVSREDRTIIVGAGVDEFIELSETRPNYMWVPETALDTPTLEVLAEQGIKGVFCAPDQVNLKYGGYADSLPTRVGLPDGGNMLVIPFDGPLSHYLAFKADEGDSLRADAYRFRDSVVWPRLDVLQNGFPLLGYTDGETFGHHKQWGVSFIDTLLNHALPQAGINVVSINNVDMSKVTVAEGGIKERSAWSCGHGDLARWHGGCNCGAEGLDQGWKGPFYAGLHILNTEVTGIVKGEFGKDYLQALRKGFKEGYNNPGSPDNPYLALISAKVAALTALTSCGTFFKDPGVSGGINILFARQAVEHLKDAGFQKEASQVWSRFMDTMQEVRNPGYFNRSGFQSTIDLLGAEAVMADYDYNYRVAV